MAWNRIRAIALICLAAVGCGDKVTVNEVEKGAESESCRSRNDCQTGLMCIDMVCTRAAASGAAGETAMMGAGSASQTTRSDLGESCQTRADCLGSLVCIDNTCLTGFAPDASVETTLSRGKRGETCEAANDCEQGLACIASRCLESDFDLMFVPKQCYRVQCASAADCCKDFKPSNYTQEQCDTMKRNCEQADEYPPPSVVPPAVTFNDCLSWTSFCRCSFECVEEQCLVAQGQYCLVDGQCTTGPGNCVDNRCVACTEDTDCIGGLARFCSDDNACVQCKSDGDCTAAGSRCVSGTCQAGCTANEHCGQLEACQEGECVHVGCATDRQCYFLTGDDRSRCVATNCQVPCASDAECTSPFHICADGVCAFAGCNSDEECRAVLKLQEQSPASLDRAVCRMPE